MSEQTQSAGCCGGDNLTTVDAVRDAVRNFYNQVATGTGPYSETVNKFSPSAPTDSIVSRVLENGSRRILDIGCGMGTTALRLASDSQNAEQVIGIDFSPEMIKRARKAVLQFPKNCQKKVGFFTADAAMLPYIDEQFDAAYSECVLNLVPDREQILAEVARVLSPNGLFCYSDFASHEPVPDSIRTDLALVSGCRAGSLTIAENIRQLEENGFKLVEQIDFTADKNQRYKELMENSPDIRSEFDDFQRNHVQAAQFLDQKVGYYLFVARRC